MATVILKLYPIRGPPAYRLSRYKVKNLRERKTLYWIKKRLFSKGKIRTNTLCFENQILNTNNFQWYREFVILFTCNTTLTSLRTEWPRLSAQLRQGMPQLRITLLFALASNVSSYFGDNKELLKAMMKAFCRSGDIHILCHEWVMCSGNIWLTANLSPECWLLQHLIPTVQVSHITGPCLYCAW